MAWQYLLAVLFLLFPGAASTRLIDISSHVRKPSQDHIVSDSGDISHDFWIIEDATLKKGTSTFSLSAVRLTSATMDKLTKAGAELTLKGFAEFFKSNGCQVSHAHIHGDRIRLMVKRPHARHACFSADVAGAIVENDKGVLSLSIEISEYISSQARIVFAPFLDPAEEALANSLANSPLANTASSETLRMGEMAWLGAECETLGCMGSRLSSDIVGALMDVLEGIDPDDLMNHLLLPIQPGVSHGSDELAEQEAQFSVVHESTANTLLSPKEKLGGLGLAGSLANDVRSRLSTSPR